MTKSNTIDISNLLNYIIFFYLGLYYIIYYLFVIVNGIKLKQ